MKVKVSDLFGYALSREVHKLAHPDEPIKEGCTAPPYASDWAFAGPIIEREGISVVIAGNGYCTATIIHDREDSEGEWQVTGPTPLTAAMRCFVVSKLGEIVEVPEELLGDEHFFGNKAMYLAERDRAIEEGTYDPQA